MKDHMPMDDQMTFLADNRMLGHLRETRKFTEIFFNENENMEDFHRSNFNKNETDEGTLFYFLLSKIFK